MIDPLVARLQAWASNHSDVTPLDGTDRDSPTFGALRAILNSVPAHAKTDEMVPSFSPPQMREGWIDPADAYLAIDKLARSYPEAKAFCWDMKCLVDKIERHSS